MRSIVSNHKKIKAYGKSRCKKEKRRPWSVKEDETMRILVE